MNNEIKLPAVLDVKLTQFEKVSNTLSKGRARVFYIGANANRVIIDEAVGSSLMSTIPGTPIVGKYYTDKGDFGGHDDGQIPYGFVPYPNANPTKVIMKEPRFDGTFVERQYYEVDVIIWDGRFPEAAKILDEEKSLSMELNPKTLQGTYIEHEGQNYVKFSHAEFIGLSVLGDDKTPCFKDAGFLSEYSKMLSEYAQFIEKRNENTIGGVEVDKDTKKTEAAETTEEVVETETVVEEVVETPAEEVVEETTEEETEVTGTDFEEETEESIDETEETEEEVIETEEETLEEETETTESPAEEELSELETLRTANATLNARIAVYERKDKEALLAKFKSKITNTEFMEEIAEKLDEHSVEELKTVLSTELADQVLGEEEAEDTETMNVNYTLRTSNIEDEDSLVALVRKHKEN